MNVNYKLWCKKWGFVLKSNKKKYRQQCCSKQFLWLPIYLLRPPRQSSLSFIELLRYELLLISLSACEVFREALFLPRFHREVTAPRHNICYLWLAHWQKKVAVLSVCRIYMKKKSTFKLNLFSAQQKLVRDEAREEQLCSQTKGAGHRHRPFLMDNLCVCASVRTCVPNPEYVL